MNIAPGQDDSPDFIAIVQGLVNGLLVREAPPSLMLIKIDNWFGSKWLGFSGKILGALGVSMPKLTVPPFVPNRVISERKIMGPPYSEAEHDSPDWHLSIPSSIALTRRVVEVAPGAILFWYSGGSKHSGRGSAMAYVPAGEAYCNWVCGMDLPRFLASRESDRYSTERSSEVDEYRPKAESGRPMTVIDDS